MLTDTLVARLCPRVRADIAAGLVRGWPEIRAAGIATPRRLQHFMAEIAVETAGLTRMEENLVYTSAARLKAVWPTRFPTDASASRCIRNPRSLAETVYGGRGGNDRPGDGWRYRGGGLLQTTFRDNYVAAGFGDDPDALRTMPGALRAALRYWTAHGLNALADADDLVAERRAINGGANGLADLERYLARAQTIFVAIERQPRAVAAVVDARPRSLAPPVATVPIATPAGAFHRLASLFARGARAVAAARAASRSETAP